MPVLLTSHAMTSSANTSLSVRHPVLLGVNIDSPLTHPDQLLEPIVALNPVVNPVLRLQLTATGLTASSPRSFRARRRDVDMAALADVLERLNSSMVMGPEGLKSLLTGKPTSKARTRAEVERIMSPHLTLSPSSSPVGEIILVRVNSQNVRIDLVTHDWLTGFNNFTPTKILPPTRLTPRAAIDFLGQTSVKLVEVSRRPAWNTLVQLLESSVVLQSVVHQPNYVNLSAGLESGVESERLTLLDALARVHQLQDHSLAVDPDVLDLGEMALAGPVGRPGLHDYQDHFCSVYAATRRGAALTLDPGMGKTIAAVVALRESLKPSERAVVVAPLSVHAQWELEIERWAPEMVVTKVQSVNDIEHCGVLLITPERLTRIIEGIEGKTFAHLVVDEARLTASKRTDALWRLRRQSRRAMILNGTPGEARGLSSLAAYVRDDPALQDADPATLGPVVFSRTQASLGTLPVPELELVKLTPYASELEQIENLHQEMRSIVGSCSGKLDARARVTLMSCLRRLRASLSSSSHESSRMDWLLGTLNPAEPTLVASDFLSSLDAAHERMVSQGLRAEILSSALNPSARMALTASFIQGDVDVLLLSPSAQRGINLQAASRLIHLDLPTNQSALSQRNGRIQRIGSPHSRVRITVPHYGLSIEKVLLDLFRGSLTSVSASGSLDLSDASVKQLVAEF